MTEILGLTMTEAMLAAALGVLIFLAIQIADTRHTIHDAIDRLRSIHREMDLLLARSEKTGEKVYLLHKALTERGRPRKPTLTPTRPDRQFHPGDASR